MKKKIIIISLILVVIAVTAFFLIRKTGAGTKYEWRTAKVEKGDIAVNVTATGSLSAVTTVQVGTQVSGIISKIFVDFNSFVKQGQVIALLDTTYLTQAVDDASASMRRAEIQVNQTKRDYDRTKQLFDDKVVAQADYDLALSSYETAVSNALSAKSSLNRAKINLRYATIIAPISGVVVSRAVDVGQTVAASFNTPTLFTIANDLTKMQVQASVDEADIGKIQVGQDVTFTVDAYEEQKFSGKVSQVRLQPTITQNVVNYTVIVDVPNPDMKLMPGMTANITVSIENHQDVLKVPAAALRFNPPQDYIDKMMKSLPDSIKQKRARWMQRSGEGAMAGGGQPGMMGQGGQGNRMQGQGQNGGFMHPHGNMGFLWIKEGDSLKMRRVRTGITDGSFTEVMGRINEGDEVVTGLLNNNQQAAATQQTNPFAPQMPRTGRGGR